MMVTLQLAADWAGPLRLCNYPISKHSPEDCILKLPPCLAHPSQRPNEPSQMSWNLLERFIESDHFNTDPSLAVAYLA
jgi:hypothetical protein